MKKISVVMILMLIAAVMPALAAFCHNCGKGLPEAANFCPGCGKEVSGAFQSAQPAPSAPVRTQPVQVQPQSTPPLAKPEPVFVPENSSLADYDFINQMEMLLTSASYGTASRQARELRLANDSRMARLESNYRYFGAYQRKLHDLHLKKQRAIEEYLEAWKGTEFGPDRARAMAEKDRALFTLGAVNEMIDDLLTGGGSLTSISRIEDMERRLQRTSGNFVVTAPYLLVDNQRLNRGEPIWVMDVVVAEARVLHMGRGRSSQPICGWVSIYDLEKRSSWRSDPAFFYSSPVPMPTTTTVIVKKEEPPVKIVIFGKKRYPYKHDRHDRGRRDKGRDRDHDHGRDRGRHGGHHDHRRYDYVVVEPRFW